MLEHNQRSAADARETNSSSESDNSMLIPANAAPISNNDTDAPVLVREIQFYWELAAAKDIADFMSRILNVLNRLGFSDYAFGRLAAKGGTEGELATTRKEALKIYQAESFYKYDMVTQHAMLNTTPIYQSTVANYIAKAPFTTEIFSRNQELHKMNAGFGCYDYYNMPINAHNGCGNVLLSITSKNMDVVEFHRRVEQAKPELHLLARAIDYLSILKFPEYFLDNADSRDIVINPRPLMLLNALAKENITLNEAADRLCMSISTANQHIAAARKALGANTTAAAVYLAIKEGLIDCKK